MGIGIVVLIWAVLGTVIAAIVAATLGGATALLTRGAMGRRKAIVTAILFPLACLAWGGAIFVFQAVVNEGILHRDLGIGDTWHAPLPNGYQIMMIDVTDQGWVYNPKTQPGSGVAEQEDAVSGVRNVQVSGKYILGGIDSKAFEHLGTPRGDRAVVCPSVYGSLICRTFNSDQSFRKLQPILATYRFCRKRDFVNKVGLGGFGESKSVGSEVYNARRCGDSGDRGARLGVRGKAQK